MEIEEEPDDSVMNLDGWSHSQTQDDDEDEDSQELFGSLSQSPETHMVGFVIVDIVGLHYYSGTINDQEMVGLVREPLNRLDHNAIRVLDTRSFHVGYIDPSAAKVLAPLIDFYMISVEGIVPNSPGNGSMIPVAIRIFAHPEAFDSVKSAISRGGLRLISSNDASFTLSEAVVVKEPTLDEIFEQVDENENKKWVMEPPKDVVRSELFLHQKEGLGWLIHRENSCELPPFWEEKDGAYVNVLTNYKTFRRPALPRGGIFADMCLGKTLTLLSLIAFDKYGCTVPSSIDTGRVKTEETEDTHFDTMVKGKSVGRLDRYPYGAGLKQTLIVCPSSRISKWVTRLGEHIRPGRLKKYVYCEEGTHNAEDLQKYDIVLTTYSTLGSEEWWSGNPLKKMKWWRVILDEAHLIKNVNDEQNRAITGLNAKRSWVVTRTPIQNGSLDLFTLMEFLRFGPYSIKSYWNSLVRRPHAEGNEEGLARLQVLVASISLRRTKDKALIGLPPKTIETCFVELSGEQRELYDQVENVAKGVFWNYIGAGGGTISYLTVLGIILRLRQMCTDLASCPLDLISFLPSNSSEDASRNPELLKKMVSLLQDGEDVHCRICSSPPSDMVITICGHIFCRSCILKTLKQNKSGCPLCRYQLLQSDLFSSPPESSNTDNSEVSCSIPSSKVFALIKLLSASRSQNRTRKSVVFSQFPKMLILLEEQLKAAGFKILCLDGSMNPIRGAHVIQEFVLAAPDGSTVLLASLKASSADMNLTAASTIYFLEPWQNPGFEDQAVDRVHRLGQKEDVKIVRIIARNSIEERILKLQEKKRKLAREPFGKKGEISINDLNTLMSL